MEKNSVLDFADAMPMLFCGFGYSEKSIVYTPIVEPKYPKGAFDNKVNGIAYQHYENSNIPDVDMLENATDVLDENLDDVLCDAPEEKRRDIFDAWCIVKKEISKLKNTTAKCKEALAEVARNIVTAELDRDTVSIQREGNPISFTDQTEVMKAIGSRNFFIDDGDKLKSFAMQMIVAEESIYKGLYPGTPHQEG